MHVILRVETHAWSLDVVGQIPALPPFITAAPTTFIEVEGDPQVSAFNRATEQLEGVAAGAAIAPLFFENTRYDFYLSSPVGSAQLRLPPTATFRHMFGDIRHYSLDFRNDVGLTEVKVESSLAPAVIRFEVFPRKIDYHTDYKHMRDEVASIAHNLVLTVQARTFGLASPFPTQQPTLIEWLSLIRYYFKKLVVLTKAIEQNPHSRLIEDTRSVPVERARRVDHQALERLLRRRSPSSGITIRGSNIQLPRRVPEITRHVTYDTAENRYVKAVLLETQYNLQRILHVQRSGDADADPSAEQKFSDTIRPEAEEMLQQIQRLLRTTFLQNVETVPLKRPASLVFHRHPQYAALENVVRALNGGLSLSGGPLQVSVKDIALLYEYWCFLKLVQMLSEQFDLEQQSIIRLSHLRITVVLQKGKQAAIRFRDRVTGKRLFLIYNRQFTKLPTIGQRPDNVIQIVSEERLYILDAKYRLAFDTDYQQQFGGIGPTVEDINTMHRYRDAIVIPHPARPHEYQRGIVQGAFVLFPYPDEAAYILHRFYKSIDQVQIGGLPFLPQTTSLVETFLRDMLQQEAFGMT